MRKQWITKEQALLILQLDQKNTFRIAEMVLDDLRNDVLRLGAASVVSWRNDGVDLGATKRGSVLNFFLRGMERDGSDILQTIIQITKMTDDCKNGCTCPSHRAFWTALRFHKKAKKENNSRETLRP